MRVQGLGLKVQGFCALYGSERKSTNPRGFLKPGAINLGRGPFLTEIVVVWSGFFEFFRKTRNSCSRAPARTMVGGRLNLIA